MPEIPDEELVRRLLADARHDEPTPADVVARLDGVLDDLSTEERRGADNVSLRPRGVRRRRWAAGLVAAAAVVTAVAVAPHLSVTSDSGPRSSSASDSSGGKSQDEAASGQVAVLSSATLAADVRAARRRLPQAPESLQSAPPAAAGRGCPAADRGPGTPVPATLDGRPAVLVLRPPADGRQVADVLACGTGRVLASVTLAAR